MTTLVQINIMQALDHGNILKFYNWYGTLSGSVLSWTVAIRCVYQVCKTLICVSDGTWAVFPIGLFLAMRLECSLKRVCWITMGRQRIAKSSPTTHLSKKIQSNPSKHLIRPVS